ncbi:sigma-54 dependent transcriptional regulator [Alteromonas sp. KUL49]|uniref:sigma-54-dependent transcriptional regulator n=1 Tax=Alteromonas sp. KUL49 TaxID=2480798 RepID=UPI0010FFBA34|nr:sigma-54 dependent transcriptional regulator [Alteromonas sp. KUL49]GEA09781.1 sigma-54-dependent Fis family transcriptional regulator [Alteromonas sp. KUL49]
MSGYRILVADDQSHIRESLSLMLEPEGYDIVEAASPAAVASALSSDSFDLILMDMNYSKDTTSGEEGIELIKHIRQHDKALPIVVMTAWANVELSVNALKLGANDFIEKPWNNARLLSLLNNQINLAQEKQANKRLSEAAKQDSAIDSVIANAPSMQPVIQLIERTAASDANILLTGESGVGKSLFAGLIHNLSTRSKAPMVSVNMGALSDTLFESELFGHQKGAFTDAKANRMGRFEMADKGTLFLDEIANIPKGLQGKLLRVLESGEYEPLGSSKTKHANVRIVSASNVDFKEEIDAGRFRQDLLYRLNTITIHIPPLRNRKEDIVAIADSFLFKLRAKYRRPDLMFSDEAKAALVQHDWPGNVRELSHCVERATLMALGDEITTQDLGLIASSNDNDFMQMTLEEAEKTLISHALESNGGNILVAAEKPWYFTGRPVSSIREIRR